MKIWRMYTVCSIRKDILCTADHSLSVSDIVVTKDGAYYCDSVGFLKVDFDEAKTQKPDNLMTVVYVEPNKAPYVTEIAHTLEAEQKAVGGLIEPIYNDDETCLVGMRRRSSSVWRATVIWMTVIP